ncbi:SMP-30/gluconolactonase/LRE family protein [Polaromonas sp.]|uniref:SMP-30/gluconolactonase/LRE family protein n=1 Tax=Polaromonas sp. TaxID=1869339 RepID=UPI002489170B|nr:SMP-30/gluconolactonase/LRE family protein [Polaromonas sp.]MDI1342459.1 SMP-30/gluconolactonase/LRE family protein [Polaromonas sp.]
MSLEEQIQALDLASIQWVGKELQRPECVLATASGDLFTADWRGGVAHVLPDGSQHLYLAKPVDGETLQPNGIALLRDGSFLLAHLGAERGGIFRLQRDGTATPFLLEVEGRPLPPSNFVVEDHVGRYWITVSTRLSPRALGYRRECNDGFIVVMDKNGARIAADGLGYANECAVHPTGQWLYVNETFSRRLSRFEIQANGDLGPKQVVAEFGAGTFPDGLCFDSEGCAWITSIVSNRLLRVAPSGHQSLWLEDSEPDHLAWVEQAFNAGQMGRPHLDQARSRSLKNISSLAFGGPGLRIGYLGCLLGESIATLPMPVTGYPPIHWNYTT